MPHIVIPDMEFEDILFEKDLVNMRERVKREFMKKLKYIRGFE